MLISCAIQYRFECDDPTYFLSPTVVGSAEPVPFIMSRCQWSTAWSIDMFNATVRNEYTCTSKHRFVSPYNSDLIAITLQCLSYKNIRQQMKEESPVKKSWALLIGHFHAPPTISLAIQWSQCYFPAISHDYSIWAELHHYAPIIYSDITHVQAQRKPAILTKHRAFSYIFFSFPKRSRWGKKVDSPFPLCTHVCPTLFKSF